MVCERRGIVISIAAMGVSFGGVVLTPLATWLVDTIGWRDAWVWLGVAATTLTLPLALIMRRAPEDHGLHPDGFSAEQIAQGRGERARLELAASFSRREAVRTFSFYALVIAFGFFSINILFCSFIRCLSSPMPDSRVTRLLCDASGLCSGDDQQASLGLLDDRTPPKPLAASVCGGDGSRVVFDRLRCGVKQPVLDLSAYAVLGLGWGGMIPCRK